MSAQPAPREVFYSYAHEDELLRNELEKHLSILHRQGLISSWHDRKIVAGTDFAKAIDTHLETASLILLLVSSDFLASDYCYGVEMKRALERHQANEARVVPILLRPVDNWQSTLIGSLQVLPTDAMPVAKWADRDSAFADIAQGIRAVLQEARSYPIVTPPDPPRRKQKWCAIKFSFQLVLGFLMTILLITAGIILFRDTIQVTPSTPSVIITNPTNGSTVAQFITIEGTAQNIPKDEELWLFVVPDKPGSNSYFPQRGPTAVLDGKWSISSVQIGEIGEAGLQFTLIPVLIKKTDTVAHAVITQFFQQPSKGLQPTSGMQLLSGITVVRG